MTIFEPKSNVRQTWWRALVSALFVLSMVVLQQNAIAAESRGNADRDARDTVGPVRDLAYGEALFEFYRDDYFAAATRLLVATQRETLKHHQDDGRLLLGGLYLSYGRQDDAALIFAELLQDGTPQAANRAWMYLAEIAWQRGNPERARHALGSMSADLDEELAAAHSLLSARIAIDEERFDDAVTVLEDWRGGKDLVSYAQFNLGVALIRHGQMQRGARYLEQVGSGLQRAPGRMTLPFVGRLRSLSGMRSSSGADDKQALRDKANLALGYAWLQHQEAARAQDYLQKVSADSAFFTKARLGAGWAATELGRQVDAVRFWEALREQDSLDPAVQEALLAIPFARNRMGEEDQALTGYQQAITQFESEIEVLHVFQQELDQGAFIQTLLNNNPTGADGWFWRIRTLPDAAESRYLYHLIADHAFQEGLKNYRDLVQLKQKLENWQDSINVYEAMLDARQQRFVKNRAEQSSGAESRRLSTLRDRFARVQQQVEEIAATGNRIALATPAEQQHWEKLQEIHQRLGELQTSGTAELVSKQRLLQGVLIWDLEQQYAPRLWSMKRAEQKLQRLVARAETLEQSLQVARTSAPLDFEGFQHRIDTLAPRIDAQLVNVNRSLGQHESYLADLAGAQFARHRERLVAYLAEARFALASTFDRAARATETAP